MKFNPQSKWFNGVDSLRFVLAFIVMLSHSDVVYATAMKHSNHLITKIAGVFLANAFDGTSAVIAFFIISGFVIHYPNKNGIPNLAEFWIRRFVRIAIPLIFILIVGIFFDHPEKTVVWSVYCELVYYALYPAFFKINLSWKNKFILAYIIAAILICSLAFHDIIAFFKQTDINYGGLYWQLGPLTWVVGLPCWMLGVLIAEHIDDLKTTTFNTVLIYRFLIYFVSCFLCFGKFHLHISYILSMNIFAFLLYKWIQTEIIYYKNKQPIATLEKMGKFSYSLYLCHRSLFTILAVFISVNFYTYPFFISLAVLIAYCFYLAVEKPSHRLARKLNSKFNYSV